MAQIWVDHRVRQPAAIREAMRNYRAPPPPLPPTPRSQSPPQASSQASQSPPPASSQAQAVCPSPRGLPQAFPPSSVPPPPPNSPPLTAAVPPPPPPNAGTPPPPPKTPPPSRKCQVAASPAPPAPTPALGRPASKTRVWLEAATSRQAVGRVSPRQRSPSLRASLAAVASSPRGAVGDRAALPKHRRWEEPTQEEVRQASSQGQASSQDPRADPNNLMRFNTSSNLFASMRAATTSTWDSSEPSPPPPSENLQWLFRQQGVGDVVTSVDGMTVRHHALEAVKKDSSFIHIVYEIVTHVKWHQRGSTIQGARLSAGSTS